ncbi:MAG: metal-sulfur cluster assembly factor [Spirochaetota bacterium]
MYSKDELLDKIRPVIDPELGFSVVDLGLIYDAKQEENGDVYVLMTLTSPMCPLGPQIRDDIAEELQKDDNIKTVRIEWTFDPPWEPETMASDDVKWELGIYQ